VNSHIIWLDSLTDYEFNGQVYARRNETLTRNWCLI
jgi:hypothetical protein